MLDPACGTGTFLYAVIDHIREYYRSSGNAGMWNGYVREHLLKRLFGFELLMAPYAMSHLKLGMQLAAQDLPAESRPDWSYEFDSNERLGVYLTNSLEKTTEEETDKLPWPAARDYGGGQRRRRGQARSSDHGCVGQSSILRTFGQRQPQRPQAHMDREAL